MALNKYMHSRNIYKVPPDFAQLAKKFPEFQKITKKDVLGKVCIDFKDPTSLRVLTKCLLKNDFDLDVLIPEDRLVPTLPLRLNYILWIEDLLKAIVREDNIAGIDIGTGACAVYPLLAAVKNKWKMIGTETDQISFKIAEENVKKNNLENLVTLKTTTEKTLLEHLFTKSEETYDFCMCNPPFYSSVQELCESRSIARPPPKNAFTGSPQELITEGGELEFIRKLIAESKAHQDKIRIFTTMVGHKYNLKELQQDLKTDNIQHVSTEFCQGRVTRWGLAWTHMAIALPSHDLKSKTQKKPVPVIYKIPKLADAPYDVETIFNKITEIFNKLAIKCKMPNKKSDNHTMKIIAMENTWSNQRKKRRQLKLSSEPEGKKLKPNDETPSNSNLPNGKCNETKEEPAVLPSTSNSTKSDKNVANSTQPSRKDPVVVAFVRMHCKDDDVILEITYLSGSGGKEGLHQIIQYIKNNLK